MTTIIGGRRIHPVTMALPEMEPDQYEGLKADLEERGQMLPILEDGEQRIVDGRHRLRAMEELGLDPWIEKIDEALGVDVTSPALIAMSLNKHRRHLTPRQLSQVAADVYEASRAAGAPITQAAAAETAGANIRGVEREIANRKGAERDVVVDGKVVHRATSKKKAKILQGLFDGGLAKPADLEALLALPLVALEDALARGVALPTERADSSPAGDGGGEGFPTSVGNEADGPEVAPGSSAASPRTTAKGERFHENAVADREIQGLLSEGLINAQDARANTVKVAGPHQIMRAAQALRERKPRPAVPRPGALTLEIGRGFKEVGEAVRRLFLLKAKDDAALYGIARRADEAIGAAVEAYDALTKALLPVGSQDASSALNQTSMGLRSMKHLVAAMAAGSATEGGTSWPPGEEL